MFTFSFRREQFQSPECLVFEGMKPQTRQKTSCGSAFDPSKPSNTAVRQPGFCRVVFLHRFGIVSSKVRTLLGCWPDITRYNCLVGTDTSTAYEHACLCAGLTFRHRDVITSVAATDPPGLLCKEAM